MRAAILLLALCGLAFGQQTTIGPVSFFGTGLNDATSGGTFTARAQNSAYKVVICTAAVPDTAKFQKNGGAFSSCVALNGAFQALTDGVTIKFTATTGHTVGDSWTINTTTSGSLSTQRFIQRGAQAIDRDAEEKLRETISIADFGAVAGTDATAAWQAALNTVSGSNHSIKITVPNNDGLCYNISSTLTHTGNALQSLNLEGALLTSGALGGSCLRWTGAAAGTMLIMTNEVNPVIRNMTFKGNALAQTLVLLTSDGTTNFNVFSPIFDHDSFAGMTGAGSAGLQLDLLPCALANVSGVTVRDSMFVGNNSNIDRGIYDPCGGNSKNITIEGGASRFTNLGTGIDYFGGNDGFVLISGPFFGPNAVDVNVSLGNVIIQNIDSEGSTRLINMGAGTNHCSLQLHAVSWAGIADASDRVVSTTGCSLEVVGSQFNNSRTPGVTVPKIALNAGLQPLCAPFCGGPALISHNNFFLNTNATTGAYYDSGGNAICTPYGGYFNANNQAAAECMGDYGGPNTFAMVKLPDFSSLATRVFTPASAVALCIPPEVVYDAAGAYFCTAASTWGWIPYSPTFGATDYVTTDTAQNITAAKEFTVDQRFDAHVNFNGLGSINGAGIASGIEFLDPGNLRTLYVSPAGSVQFAKPAGIPGNCVGIVGTGTLSKQVVGAVANVLVVC